MNKLKIAKLALGPLKFIWKNKLLRNLVGAAVAKIIKGVARKKVGAVKANVGAKMVGAKAKVAAGAGSVRSAVSEGAENVVKNLPKPPPLPKFPKKTD